MNKLTIPAILVATVMVAGAFAFMPVQQASTVHTSTFTVGLLNIVGTDTDMDVGDDLTLTCTAPFIVEAITFETENAATGENVQLITDFDGVGLNWDPVIVSADIVDFDTTPDGSLLDFLHLDIDEIHSGTDGTVDFNVLAEAADGDDELLRLAAAVRTTGTCTFN